MYNVHEMHTRKWKENKPKHVHVHVYILKHILYVYILSTASLASAAYNVHVYALSVMHM